MNLKKLTLAAAAGTALLAAAPAFANPPHWAPAYGWHAKHRHHYQPSPVVIYGQVPASPGVRVRFGVRL